MVLVQEVPVSNLSAGDMLIIKPNSKIPADGYIVQGNSTVNQAPITGREHAG